jgi:hypothetical protein
VGSIGLTSLLLHGCRLEEIPRLYYPTTYLDIANFYRNPIPDSLLHLRVILVRTWVSTFLHLLICVMKNLLLDVRQVNLRLWIRLLKTTLYLRKVDKLW